MSTITVPAINAEYFPLNFLAALGLQQVLCRETGRDVRLYWEQLPLWTAVVTGLDSFDQITTILQEAASKIAADPVWRGMQESSDGSAATGVAQIAIATYREYMQSIAWDTAARRWMGLVTEWPENKKKSMETITKAKKAVHIAESEFTTAQKPLIKLRENTQKIEDKVMELSKTADKPRKAAQAHQNKLLAARTALDKAQRELAEAQECAEAAAEVARHASNDLAAIEKTLEATPDPDLHYASTSRLHMLTGGQTNLFLQFIRDAAIKAADKPDAFTEALQGPWHFEDSPALYGKGWDELTLGWYSDTQRGWAYSAGKPENMKKTTTAGVAWLAGEGLPSLPSWIGGKEVRTTGILDQGFTFPMWNTPLSLAAVRRLLMSVTEDHSDQWRRRGVDTMLRCEKGESSTEYKHVWLSPRMLW